MLGFYDISFERMVMPGSRNGKISGGISLNQSCFAGHKPCMILSGNIGNRQLLRRENKL